MPSGASNQRKGVQSVEQGVDLLRALVNSREPLPLKTIARLAGMSPSMAHRYLASLIRSELAHQDPATGLYSLGTFALRLGIAALNRTDLIQIVDDEFRQLVGRVNVDGHLSVWGDYGATIIRIHNRHIPVLTNLRLGAVLSLLGSASGRVFLAYQREETIAAILKAELSQSEDKKPSKKEIAAIAREVRLSGFAWIDGQVLHGMRAIAAPIFDPQGELRGAMSLVSNQADLVQFPNATLDDLLDTASRTSRRLGWQS